MSALRLRPRVNSGLPVYNGERFLEEILNSLLNQTYSEFEPIILMLPLTKPRQFVVCMRPRSHVSVTVGWHYSRVYSLSTGEYFRWATGGDVCKRTSWRVV
jgi:hypothetical protein